MKIVTSSNPEAIIHMNVAIEKVRNDHQSFILVASKTGRYYKLVNKSIRGFIGGGSQKVEGDWCLVATEPQNRETITPSGFNYPNKCTLEQLIGALMDHGGYNLYFFENNRKYSEWLVSREERKKMTFEITNILSGPDYKKFYLDDSGFTFEVSNRKIEAKLTFIPKVGDELTIYLTSDFQIDEVWVTISAGTVRRKSELLIERTAE